jgi:hypothetical protein
LARSKNSIACYCPFRKEKKTELLRRKNFPRIEAIVYLVRSNRSIALYCPFKKEKKTELLRRKKYPKIEAINSYVKTTFLNSTEWRGEGANCRVCPQDSPSRPVPPGPFQGKILVLMQRKTRKGGQGGHVVFCRTLL